MKIKSLLAGALFVAAAATANAESLYLHIQQADGNWSVIDIAQVDKLTFKNGGMQVLDANDKVVKEIPSEDLQTLKVNDSSAGIAATAADDAQFRLQGRVLDANASGRLAVYDVAGRLCVEIPQLQAGQSVDLTVLPAGIYVVILNDVASKIELR